MPCYTVQTVSVAFKVAHIDLLEKAAKSLGYNYAKIGNVVTLSSPGAVVKVDLTRGVAVAQDQQLVNELKRAYSQQAIKLAAKLGGWQVKNLSSTNGQLVRGCL
jgi:hypothetical protein